MKIDLILDRLEKARKTGSDSWIACCPAHKDKHPSMTLRECEDGRILLHCFTGCSVPDILGAIGMEFDALFPDKPLDYAAPIRRPFPAADVIEALASETLIVGVAASTMGAGKQLSKADHERLLLACERIEAGRSIANG